MTILPRALIPLAVGHIVDAEALSFILLPAADKLVAIGPIEGSHTVAEAITPLALVVLLAVGAVHNTLAVAVALLPAAHIFQTVGVVEGADAVANAINGKALVAVAIGVCCFDIFSLEGHLLIVGNVLLCIEVLGGAQRHQSEQKEGILFHTPIGFCGPTAGRVSVMLSFGCGCLFG